MNAPLLEAAYTIAREKYEAARLEAFSILRDRFPDAGFDPTHHAVQRGMKLYLSAYGFAEKVWAGSIPYEKAYQSLHSQFNDFPEATVERAFSEAYRDTR